MDRIIWLRKRLGITDNSEDELLAILLNEAMYIFLNARYPSSDVPVDGNGKPIIEKRWDNIITRIAIELYSREGAEGQVSYDENGVRRTYESGDISPSLLAQIPPVVGIARR